MYARNPWSFEYQRIPSLVADALRAGLFQTVIEWDPVTGVYGRDAGCWDDLAKQAVTIGEIKGKAYSVAPEEAFEAGSSNIPVSTEDFVAVMLAAMADGTDKLTAFIVNFANFVFPSSQHPSRDERTLFARLAKAVIGQSDVEAICQKNLLVLFSASANALPLTMLPGTAHVREVIVPLPDRDERNDLIADRLHEWRLKNRPMQGHIGYDDLIDALDGMSLQDLLNIEELSRRSSGRQDLTVEQLLSLYRHGIQTSPWEALSREKLLAMPVKLAERVKGQSHAIEKVTRCNNPRLYWSCRTTAF